MNLWPFTARAAYGRRLTARARSAYLIREDLLLQRELPRNHDLAEQALLSTKDDDVLYERILRTPMPPVLQRILTTEMHLWWSIRDDLARLAEREMPPATFKTAIQTTRTNVEDLYALTLLATKAYDQKLTRHDEAAITVLVERWDR